jgi:enamine deaminase RidA (YjgF/YER057c/UK114 family)
MRALDRLRKSGFELPEPPPRHQFVPVAVVGDLAFVSGHAPYRDGAFRFKGKVGRKLDLSAAQQAAGLALLGCLRSLHDRFETLDAVKRILKLNAYVMECMTSNCVYEASVGPEPGTTFQGGRSVRRGILQTFAPTMREVQLEFPICS